MSHLVVLGFDGLHTADEVLDKVRALHRAELIDLEDACVIERDSAGKVYLKQAVDISKIGARAGGFKGAMFGTLVGLLVLNPLAGLAVGALAGTGLGRWAGSLVDIGIPDDFLKKMGGTIPSGSSALAVAFLHGDESRLLSEISSYKPRVLKASLSSDSDQRLTAALASAAA